MAVRTSNSKSKNPKWTWGLDDFDSQEEVEAAILESIFEQVVDEDDTPEDPDGKSWDVVVSVNIVPRGTSVS